MRPLHASPALAVLLLVSGCGVPATPQAPVSAAVSAPDTLALLDLHLATGVLDSVMAAEGNRLDLACASGEAACRRALDPSRIVPLDILRAQPAARAPAVGILAAHVHVPAHGWLSADFVFVGMAEGRTTPPVVLKPMGDWGYGVHIAVRAWTGVVLPDGETRHWVRIPGAGSAEGGWLALEHGGLRGWITPAEDPVWWLGEEVTTQVGAEGRVEPGLQLGANAGVPFEHGRILRIQDGWVTLREELPSDMPCGRDIPPDPAEPAIVRIRLSDLFATSGTPRIEPAYPRGC